MYTTTADSAINSVRTIQARLYMVPDSPKEDISPLSMMLINVSFLGEMLKSNIIMSSALDAIRNLRQGKPNIRHIDALLEVYIYFIRNVDPEVMSESQIRTVKFMRN